MMCANMESEKTHEPSPIMKRLLHEFSDEVPNEIPLSLSSMREI